MSTDLIKKAIPGWVDPVLTDRIVRKLYTYSVLAQNPSDLAQVSAEIRNGGLWKRQSKEKQASGWKRVFRHAYVEHLRLVVETDAADNVSSWVVLCGMPLGHDVDATTVWVTV